VGPWLAAGLVTGLACLARGNLILLLPPAAAWLLLRSEDGDESRGIARLGTALGRRARWRATAAYAVGVGLVLALPAIHNYYVGGEFILSTANAGANFYIGNNPWNRTGEYQQLPFINANPKWEQHDFQREAERRAGRPLTDRECSVFWFHESGRFIRESPGQWVTLLGRKVHRFWGAFEIPDSLDYYLYRETAPVLRLPVPGFGLLGPLSLLGAALAWRRRGWPRLLIWFVVAYSVSIVVFFVFSRFRIVIAPALYVFAAHAAVELARRWRAIGPSRPARDALVAALGPTALFVALFAFVNL
jgi:4-amino-4-deoxy-L-arabinose transferase-like glycosyltransferase